MAIGRNARDIFIACLPRSADYPTVETSDGTSLPNLRSTHRRRASGIGQRWSHPSMPAKTVTPVARRTSLPAPEPVRSGAAPAMKATDVMMIGRKRRRQASRAASSVPFPLYLELACKVDDQNGFLACEAHQHDQVDLHEDIIVSAVSQTPERAANMKDGERHRPAFVQGAIARNASITARIRCVSTTGTSSIRIGARAFICGVPGERVSLNWAINCRSHPSSFSRRDSPPRMRPAGFDLL
jgi:hypothetical protein